MAERHEGQRLRMVERQLVARGIKDERVLEAMRRVPREAFVPVDLAEFAYDDNPLPIAEGQTISQPYIVALMAAAAKIGPKSRVLEVGTGSGYAAAVLAQLAAEVVTIERHEPLAQAAADVLRGLGYFNVEVLAGDGSAGVAGRAPYDAILVAASAPAAPESLKSQLGEGGRLVVPVSSDAREELLVFTRSGDNFSEESLGPVRFVPLMGDEGWLEHKHATGASSSGRRARSKKPRM